MSNENAIKAKSLSFAKRIVKVYRYLCEEKHEYVLSKQLLRSGTSIGANITEAQYGSSRKDFAAKLQIARKEAAETLYWLELLQSCNYLSDKQYESLSEDCRERIAILTSTNKTLEES